MRLWSHIYLPALPHICKVGVAQLQTQDEGCGLTEEMDIFGKVCREILFLAPNNHRYYCSAEYCFFWPGIHCPLFQYASWDHALPRESGMQGCWCVAVEFGAERLEYVRGNEL